MSLVRSFRLATVSQGPSKRRCVASLAPRLSEHDRGIAEFSAADDPLKLRALGIIQERRQALYGNLLPDRVEVRFLPPHMMHFPGEAWHHTANELGRSKDGLPAQDLAFDAAVKRILSVFKRRKEGAPPRIRLEQDGPRLNNLSLRRSYRYPTSFPEGQEGQGQPTLGMTILLSRSLQSDYELRSFIERELCMIAEMNALGRNLKSPVFRLLRAMLADPSILVTQNEVDSEDKPRLQCLQTNCGHSEPLDHGEPALPVRCPRCQSQLARLTQGSASLPKVLSARYGNALARVSVPAGYVLLQILRALVWPATPIWSSPTPGDIALRTVAFLFVVVIGGTMLLYWLAPKSRDTFLGNVDRIRALGTRRSQAAAKANVQEELRQLMVKDGMYPDPKAKV